MEEVTGPVIAIVLVLCAVFIPVSFLGGLAGELYRQFAVTIAVSVVISGIVALTLTPALAALMLKPEHGAPWPPFAAVQPLLRLADRRATPVAWASCCAARCWALAGFVVVLGLVFALFQRVPGSLVPAEDQGYVFMVTVLPPAAAIARTREVTKEATAALLKNPAVANVVTFSGFDLLSRALKTNSGISFVTLKDWSQRTDPQGGRAQPRAGARRHQRQLPDGIVIGFNPPPIIGISVTGGFEFFLQDRSGGSLRQPGRGGATRWWQAANQRPELRGVSTTFSAAVPQYRIDVDRDKARALGVPINSIFDTMQASFGSLYVNDFSLFGRTYRVSLSSEADFREIAGRPAPRLRARRHRGDGAAERAGDLHPHPRPRHGRPLQYLPGRQDPGRPRAGLFVGPGDRRHAGRRGQDALQRLHHRLDRLGLPGAGNGRARARWASSSA